MRLPSGSRSTHVGNGSGTNDSMRSAPSGCTTSGAYCWEVSGTVPSWHSSQASDPFTSTTRPAGGVVAVKRSAWYRRVRMPLTVPEAKPPRPSASSHSARLCEGFMAGHEVVAACRRGAVLEGADLALGTAHPDAEHAEPNVARRPQLPLRLIDQSDLASVREDGDGLHVPWMYAPTR